MPLFPPPPFGTFINFYRTDDIIYVQYNGFTTPNNIEDVTIDADFLTPDPFTTKLNFQYDDGSGVVEAMVYTTLDHVKFNGALTVSEEDYYTQVNLLFARTPVGEFIYGYDVFPYTLATGVQFLNDPADTYHALITSGAAPYTANQTIYVPNQSGTLALLTDIPTPVVTGLTTTGTSGVATLISGTLNVPNYTYTLPTATNSVLGGVKVDGTTITISSGVISAAVSPSYWSRTGTILYPTTAGDSIGIPQKISSINIGYYGTISETGGGYAYITGNSIKSDPAVDNQLIKTSNDDGHFIRMLYSQGISFHTGLSGSTGTTYADSTNNRFKITNTGRLYIGVAPNSSTGSYVVLTRNISTGEIETVSGSAVTDFIFTNGAGFTGTVTTSTTTPTLSLVLQNATTSQSGQLTATDWNTFNGKQSAISLTTTGTSGVATFTSGTLNIPNYTYTLPTASTTVLGGVKVDGTSITIASGVISATAPTYPVTSVFGRTGAVVATSGDYTTAQVTEVTNLYFTNARARSAVSITTTGASGAATYNSSTGVFNIPNYGSAGSTWSGLMYGTSYGTGNLTLATTATQYTFQGSSPATWTLSAYASPGNFVYFIKNAGSATLTVQRAGSDMIYNTASVTSFTIAPGESAMVSSAASSLTNTWTVLFYNPVVTGTNTGDVTLTTTGTSGVATLTGQALNIPNYTYTLPTASVSVLGGVKVDGTSITISSGVISATATATPSLQAVTNIGATTTNGIYTDSTVGFNLVSTLAGGSSRAQLGKASDKGFLYLGNAVGYGGTVKADNLAGFRTYQLPDNSGTIALLTDIPSATFTSLTTTGTSGVATLTSGVLNIPNYTYTETDPLSIHLTGTQSSTGTIQVNIGANSFNIIGTSGGFYASSTGNNAIYGESTGASLAAAGFSIYHATTNTIDSIIDLYRQTSGTAANGIGGSVKYYINTTTGSNQVSTELISKWTNATNATRTSQFIITGVNSAVTADLFTLSGSGALKINKYGVGTFTGTPAYNLVVDSSGNLIETALSGAGTVTNFVFTDSGGFTGTVTTSTTTPTLSLVLQNATTSQSGQLTSTDWNTFNNKQATISLTTTGTSGAATFSGGTLNIPIYSSYIPTLQLVTNAGNSTYNAINLINGATLSLANASGFSFVLNANNATSTTAIALPQAAGTLVMSVNGNLANTSGDVTISTSGAVTSLTTTGTSGVATLISTVLNIPNYTYTLPTASASVLGGVKVGTGLSISSGVLSSTITQGVTRNISSISANTTAAASSTIDYIYKCTATLTLTLPTAVGNTNRYTVKNTGSGTVTIACNGVEQIEGASTIAVAASNSVDIFSDNTGWYVI